MDTAPAPAPEPRSPVLANLVAILGFVLIFSTFATESVWSWILGAGLLVAAGLWAGLAPTGGNVGEGASHGRAT